VAHLELKHPGTTVRARQFPLSREDAAEIDRQILEMEEIGLRKARIRHSTVQFFSLKRNILGKQDLS